MSHILPKHYTGFTLLELLVVIAIVGVLASISIIAVTGGPKKARDAKRQSEIKQYQNAIEIYASKASSTGYPVSGTANATTICATLGLSNCPDDPVTTYHYMYNGALTQYVLWTRLETKTPVQYFVTCSNGKNGTTTTNPNPAGGACPI
jgi:prepilin-type N-terminal cleavage/methylation domain-containing protein